MGRIKLKEPNKINIIPKNNNIYINFGHNNINDWLERTIFIVKKNKNLTNDTDEFIKLCINDGLKITNNNSFLRIYWYKKK